MDNRLHVIEKRLSELEKLFHKNTEEDEYKKYLEASQSKKTLDAIGMIEQTNVILRKESKSFVGRTMSMWPKSRK